MREGVYAAVIKDYCILLVGKKGYWSLPGGKTKGDETDSETVTRELGEEVLGLEVKGVKYFNTIVHKTPTTHQMLEARIYLVDVDIVSAVFPGEEEIDAVMWMKNVLRVKLYSDFTEKIIKSLREHGYF